MFVVLLTLAEKRAEAPRWMAAHKAWLQQGFDDGVFLASGDLAPQAGGAVVARGLARAAIEARVAADPFVQHGVVRAEIMQIRTTRTAAGLQALLDEAGA